MKRFLSIFLCIVICCSVFSIPASASESRDLTFEETLATDLKQLNLMKGVSDTDFALERVPTRIEALIMLIRLLGKEQEALSGSWNHPFDDVADWADPYVGYAYETGLTKGVSDSKFGNSNSDARTYLTFVLRALGYSDAEGDFSWENPTALAKQVGILPERTNLTNFLRADLVLISYAALSANLKQFPFPLAEKLAEDGVFTWEEFQRSYLPMGESDTAVSEDELNPLCVPASFTVEAYGFNGELRNTGRGFFVSSDGLAVTSRELVLNAASFKITLASGKVCTDVKLIRDDHDTGLALLRVSGIRSHSLIPGDSSALQEGQQVYIVNSDNTMSACRITDPLHDLNGMACIRFTGAAPTHGGPLVDKFGHVVGVVLPDTAQDCGLAIPINALRTIDRTGTVSTFSWETHYLYATSYYVPEFFDFSGVDMLNWEETDDGMLCTYDGSDFYDNFRYSAADHAAISVSYYVAMLESYGFVRDTSDTWDYCLYNDVEYVLIYHDKAGSKIYIMVGIFPT